MVSGFVHLLKLGQTLAFANRTIVSPAINRDVPNTKRGPLALPSTPPTRRERNWAILTSNGNSASSPSSTQPSTNGRIPSHPIVSFICMTSFLCSGTSITHGWDVALCSALESGAGERTVPEPGGDDLRSLLPAPNRDPSVVHVLPPRVPDFASVHDYLRERRASSVSGDRGLVQPDWKPIS